MNVPASDAPVGGFRPDIEGLRTVAIVAVLLYHAQVAPFTGGYVGVDVFFVVSGFLITGLLLREIETHGRIRFGRFYARRAKRLLPASALVLVATTLLVWASVSRIDWRNFGGDIVASALYVVNWRFADRSVDYLAEGTGLSPVLHFWSLAVEEQFYVVWPLLLFAAVVVSRRAPAHWFRPIVSVALALVVVPSFLWSLHLTDTSPSSAFFVTTTRLWELGIGAFLAVGVRQWERVRPLLATLLGWVGLAAIVTATVAFGSTTPWPGARALVPTLGAALLIIGGACSAARFGPYGLLSTRPARVVGGLSYSLYLWHWPLLAVAASEWGWDLADGGGVFLVAVSVVPAVLCHYLFENPVRFAPRFERSTRAALALGAVLTLVGVVAGFALVRSVPSTSATIADAPGAAVLADDPLDDPAGAAVSTSSMTPDPLQATSDLPRQYADGCQQNQESAEIIACEYGDPNGDVSIAIVGDSKAVQYMSAFEDIALRYAWNITTYTKSNCSFTAADPAQPDGSARYPSCGAWNDALVDLLIDDPPDLVVASHYTQVAYAEDADEPTRDAMRAGLERRWQELLDQGISVAALLDNAAPPEEVYRCVEANRGDLTRCTFDRTEGLERGGYVPQRDAAANVPGVAVIDLVAAICPVDPCAPVIGEVLVYRQGSHITDTYARTLTPRLESILTELVG